MTEGTKGRTGAERLAAPPRRTDDASLPGGIGDPQETLPSVLVQANDALEDVVDRLNDLAGDGRAVRLAIPLDSALFLTASEFRALKDVANRRRIAVTVRSPDPLRLRLAQMLGFDAASDPRPQPARRPAPPTPLPPAPPSTVADAGPVPRPGLAPRGAAASPQATAPPRPAPLAAPGADPHPTPATAAAPGRSAESAGSARVALAVAPAVAPSAPPSATPTPASAPPATEMRPTSSPPQQPTPRAVAPSTVAASPPGPGPVPVDASIKPGVIAESPVVPDPGAAADSGVSVNRDSVMAPEWPAPPPPRTEAPRGRWGRLALPRGRAMPVAPVEAPPQSNDPPPPATSGGQNGMSLGAPAPMAVPVGELDPDPEIEAAVAPPVPPRSVPKTRREWRGRIAAHRRPVAIGAGIALAALVAGGVAVGLPRADVAVVLKRELVRAELLYDVTNDGEPLSAGATLAVAAEPATVEVTVEESIPTTGVRLEPDGTASGPVRLANPTADQLTVEQGTVVSTESGAEFAFADDVTVPAADADAGDVGSATGEVRALEPGRGGNVETGEIGGRLPNGVYYSNRDGPTEGGTDREIRVAAPDDLETLAARVDEAIPVAAGVAFERELGQGTAALPSSFSVGKGRTTFEHEAGDDAKTIAVTAVRSVTALVYDPEAVEANLDDELADQLATEAPSGFAVDRAAVTTAPPEVVQEAAAGTRFRLRAEAEAEAILDNDERQALADRLEGVDPEEVEGILTDIPQVERFSIDYRPRWLPDRMPGSAGRIAIEAKR